MNKISTGAFLNEMDASNKQLTMAEKFAAVWEKKNAKAARAGGVSLMALSLAACGSSSDDTASAPTTPTTPTTPTPPAPTSASLTITDGDVLTGTTGNNVFNGSVSGTASKQTYDAADKIIDASATDADVLNVTATLDVTTAATVTNVETVNFTVDALSASGGAGAVTDFDVVMTNISKGTTVNFDSVGANSIISGLIITGDAGGTRTTSDDFTTVKTTLLANADATFDVNAVGTSASAVAFTAVSANAGDTLVIDAAGYLDVTAGDIDELVKVDAVNNLTITDAGDADAVLATAGGNMTVKDANTATVVQLTAGGNISVTADKLEAALAPVIKAGGTLSVDLNAATEITAEGAKTITISDDAANDTLTTVDVTVKTEKTTIDLTDTDGVSTVFVRGDQDYILNMDASSIDGLTSDKLSLTDSTTAGTGVLKLSTAAGNVDATAITIDEINVAVDNQAKTLTVKSGQAVTISTDQTTTASVISSKAATATTNSVNITLDDGTDSVSTAAVDLATFTLSNIATANIDASKDTLLSGAAETHNITTFTGNVADVNLTMGANNLGLKGLFTLGATNTLTITGSGKVTGDTNEVITAKTADLSAVTGVVTLEHSSEKLGTLITGSGKDVITVVDAGGTEKDFTLKTGAGDDKVTLDADGAGGESATIDLGEGTDTIAFVDNQALTRTGTDLNTIEGAEKMTYGGAFTVDSSVINNKTWEISESATATDDLTVTVLASDTAIDLSGLTVTTANAAAVALDTFVIDASGAGVDGVTSIKGALITKNTITANDLDATTIVGGNKADALNGGAKADTITGGEGADVITGNAGDDTIILTETTSAVDKVTLIATSNGKDTIKGFNSAKDIVNLEGGVTGNDSTGAVTVAAINTALSTGGAAWDISGSIATTDHLVIVGTALSTKGDLDASKTGSELFKALSTTDNAVTGITVDATHKGYMAFYQDGNAYIYQADAGSTVNTDIAATEIDLVAVLEGVGVGELTTADFLIV